MDSGKVTDNMTSRVVHIRLSNKKLGLTALVHFDLACIARECRLGYADNFVLNLSIGRRGSNRKYNDRE